MKKTIILFLFLAGAGMTTAQQLTPQEFLRQYNDPTDIQNLMTESVWLVDSTYCFNADQEGGGEFPANRQYNEEYNEDGRILRQLDQTFIDGAFQNTARHHFTYGTGEFLTESRNETWDAENEMWVNTDRILFTYNPAAGAYSEYIFQNWENGMWVNFSRTVDTHNAGHQKPEKSDGYLWENGMWVQDFAFYYSVNIQTLNTVGTLFQKRNAQGVLQNQTRSFIDYDANNNQTQIRRENFSEGIWTEGSKTDFAYDEENRRISEIQSVFNNATQVYVPQSKTETEYNAIGEQSLIAGFGYNQTEGEFVPSYRTAFEYDANENFVEFSNEIYQNETWVYTGRCQLYWSQYQVNAVDNFSNKITCHMANPYTPGQQIYCERSGEATLELYDLRGKLRAGKEVNTAGNLSIDQNLQSGLYILLLRDETGILFRKKIAVQN